VRREKKEEGGRRRKRRTANFRSASASESRQPEFWFALWGGGGEGSEEKKRKRKRKGVSTWTTAMHTPLIPNNNQDDRMVVRIKRGEGKKRRGGRRGHRLPQQGPFVSEKTLNREAYLQWAGKKRKGKNRWITVSSACFACQTVSCPRILPTGIGKGGKGNN